MADSKVTQLDENTTVASTDVLYLVDDPGGTPAPQKATVANVVGAAGPKAHNHTAAAGEGGVLTDDEHDGFIEIAEISKPDTPAANKLRLYVKDKGGVSALYFLKDDGTEVEVGAGGSSQVTSGYGTITSVADSATMGTLLAANANRTGASVYNHSTANLYVAAADDASTSSFTVMLQENDYWEAPFGYTGVITGIWASDAGGTARVTEYEVS